MIALTNSQLIANCFRQLWNDKLKFKEVTYIIYLNDKRQMLFHAELCTGRDKECMFDLKEALRYALTIYSDYVVIAHNHTSGNAEPSEDDIKLTEKVKNVLANLNIVLIDHIILTPNDYYSFADNGHLSNKSSA